MIFPVSTITIKSKTILEACEIDIPEHSITVIQGKNGSGKTLLLNSLFSYCKDNKISACMLDQSSDLVLTRCSVLENISMSTSSEDNLKAIELLRKYNLEHLTEHRINELSGGEKRMVCLLRCLYFDYDYCFFDEPSNDLDYVMVEKIKRVMEELSKRCTIIIVTHDDRFTSLASVIFTIKNRQLVGNEHSYLFDSKKAYSVTEKQFVNSFYLLIPTLKKSISSNAISRMLLVLFSICILYFSYIFVDSSKNTTTKRQMAHNEINIFIPLSDYASVALSDGAIPIQALSCLNDDLHLTDKVKLYREILHNQGSIPINYGLSLPKNYNWIEFECEFYDVKERQIINPIDEYSKRYTNGMSLNTTDYFYAFFDGNIDKSVQFDSESYQHFTEELKKEYMNNGIECTWLVICLKNVDFYEFINSKELSELMRGNFYIISSETIDFSIQVESFILIKQHTIRCVIACAIFSLLSVCSSFAWEITNLKPIKVFKNCGAIKETLLEPVHTLSSDSLFFFICIFIANLLMIYIYIKCGSVDLISSYSGNLLYFVSCLFTRWIHSKNVNRCVDKAFNWRSRL